ncbi:MAG TPA: hypothetical protein VIT91_05940 [Chthoniobacterales bacterium]
MSAFAFPNDTDDPAQNVVAFTLCEPHYYAGAAALLNSLIVRGFRGTFIVGIKGEPAGWLTNLPTGLPAGVFVRVVSTPNDRHLANNKALFALHIFDELEPACKGVAYFDPDIVVKATWREIVERIVSACSVCADENTTSWAENADEWSLFAFECTGQSPSMNGPSCNSGFIGVAREHRAVLSLWEELLLACFKRGFDPKSFVWHGQRSLPFYFVDQDTLNLTIRLTDVPVWIGGPETMDFEPGGNWISHAICTPKPWDRWYLPRALAGRKVRRCDIAFWQHVTAPIPAMPRISRWCHRIDLACARLLDRNSSP